MGKAAGQEVKEEVDNNRLFRLLAVLEQREGSL